MSLVRGAALAAIAVLGFAFAEHRGRGGDAAPDASAAAPAATDAPPARPARPIPPDPFDDDAAMAKHAEKVASYTLRAKVDPKAHTLHGEGEISWTNATDAPTDELWVHLYLNAFKNQKTVNQRMPLYGFRGSGTPESWGWIKVRSFVVKGMNDDKDVWEKADKTSPGDPDDETDIRVPLPNTVAPGDTLTIEVAWDETLPTVLERTGYEGSFHMFGQWFPKIARREKNGDWKHFTFDHLSEFYADFGHYDVTIDVPDGFIVGASGTQREEKKEAGRVIRRFEQDDVHDFSFTAWDKFHERNDEHDGVAIRTLFPPGNEHNAEIEVADVEYALDRLGKAYGRYPYDHLTIVHPPDGAEEAGGMEYPTLITTGGPWWLPYTGAKFIQTTAVHELGHQWFYGLVATDEHNWPFLDEGVNSYAEIDVMEARYPNESMLKAFGLDVSIPAVYRALSSDVEQDAPVAQPTTAFTSGSDYGGLVYERTSIILLTLGHVYGEEAVQRAVGRYARKQRFLHPTPDDFIDAFRTTLGDDVADTLHAALFDRATVDFSVDGFTSHADEAPKGIFGDPDHPAEPPAGNPDAWRGEVLVRRKGELVFPVDIEMIGQDGTKTRTTWDGKGSSTRLPYAGKSELVTVVVDPEHRVLLDDNLGNNARTVRPRRLSPRTLERVWWLGELGISAVTP
jgi:Peptidase family M1 domain